eukprot:TRINITY_DN5545_c0_g1_i10.p1 TRINITY_DN5545_c0_g1~~TRINITY_DN5545_c0_g1_i10.p1  ORF type:complete len:166 (-),score=22.62 TRINITY_DN5545_c0_g1_i10:33-530(-)
MCIRDRYQRRVHGEPVDGEARTRGRSNSARDGKRNGKEQKNNGDKSRSQSAAHVKRMEREKEKKKAYDEIKKTVKKAKNRKRKDEENDEFDKIEKSYLNKTQKKAKWYTGDQTGRTRHWFLAIKHGILLMMFSYESENFTLIETYSVFLSIILSIRTPFCYYCLC